MKDKNRSQGHTATLKRRLIYYIVLGVCVLVLSAAIVITVMAATGRFSTPKITDIETDHPTESGDAGEVNPSNPTSGEPIVFSNPLSVINVAVGNDLWKDPTLDYYYVHQGYSFSGNVGDSVYCVLDGVVESVNREKDSEETEVIIDHGNNLKTVYKCIKGLDSLSSGVNLKKGDKIGDLIETKGYENKEGPHLHFCVLLDNKNVDPQDYFTFNEK